MVIRLVVIQWFVAVTLLRTLRLQGQLTQPDLQLARVWEIVCFQVGTSADSLNLMTGSLGESIRNLGNSRGWPCWLTGTEGTGLLMDITAEEL